MKMIKLYIIICMALIVSGCNPVTESIESKESSSSSSIDLVKSNLTSVLDFGFSLPIPDVFKSRLYPEKPHIIDFIIMNGGFDKNWPSSNTITIVQFVPNLRKDLNDYLVTVCTTGRIDGRPNPFDVVFKQSINGYEIWKIQKNCSGDDNIYIPPRYIEYLIIKDGDVFVARIDDEASDDDMERFEKLILSIQ